MGTVGLSFGSPTSGAGFDVSSTVSTIVANLQNVETPWKTQLTSLESQDTAISSLGTLFSNLSNDMSALTDATGILAQMEGSSSDTSVLTLTAATAAALAGTHAVSVSNLATTSSGYLAEIPSATDTLSGSIDLQVGSGTAQTITVPTAAGQNTLAGLAAAINSSSVGVSASVLTDATGSRLSLVSGTSGAAGNISVITNGIVDTTTHLGTTLVAGQDANAASGAGASSSTATTIGISDKSDALSGAITIQVGTGAAQTITVGTTSNTLASLAAAIAKADTGVTAAVVQNSPSGTYSLQLSSAIPGAAGTLTVSSTLIDTGADATTALAYTTPVKGVNANLTVDGVSLTSASNTVANLIPGVTFQLLAPSAKESDGSLEQVQVVIANDNAGVESSVASFVSDYNALIGAINTQEGDNSSGSPEPLFGSPTLSLLQQQLMNGLNAQNPNGYLTEIPNGLGTTLSGSITIGQGTNKAVTFNLASGADDAANGTYFTGDSTAAATLSGLAGAINDAGLGFTATVVENSDGTSDLALQSQTAGSAGALSVTSGLKATSGTLLTYGNTSPYSLTTADGGLIGGGPQADVLSGSVTLRVGSGATTTIPVPADDATLAGLAGAINSAHLNLTATAVESSNGAWSISLVSGVVGSGGALTVDSSIVDTTNTTTSDLSYTQSSDIGSLTSLGISVNNDGSIALDAASLDSLLNTDYSGILGMFQDSNSWGLGFANMLTNAGTGTSADILALASSSNRSIESTLNADISKEQMLISAQQTSLTAELNSANEIMQELPSQIAGVNELYSAITGYNQNSGG